MEPRNGMGVTIHVGSDRYPGTIVYVSANQKTIRVAPDAYKMKAREDFSSPQEAVFVPREGRGDVKTFTLRRNGRYYLRGTKIGSGCFCTLGARSVYFDPHF